VSFILFPLGLLGDLVAAVLGGIAVTRGRAKGATNPGQATAGIVCGVLALAIAIVFAVRFGTFVARNTNVFTTFDNCIATAGNRSAVSSRIARLANDIRHRIISAQPAAGKPGQPRRSPHSVRHGPPHQPIGTGAHSEASLRQELPRIFWSAFLTVAAGVRGWSRRVGGGSGSGLAEEPVRGM
jgi:hypothetical protein